MVDVPPLGTKGVDERAGDDDAVGGLRKLARVRWRRHPEADRHGDRTHIADLPKEATHPRRQALARSGHAGERDGIEEALRAGGHERSPRDRCRRRDEVDDGQARVIGLRLERGALVRGQIGQDEARHAGLAEPPQDRGAIAATEHLVDIAHGHERCARARGVDAADQLDRVVEPRAVPQRDRAGSLERGAIGEGVGVGQADLEEVRPGIDERDRDLQRTGSIGVAGHGIGDERGPSIGRSLLEGSRRSARSRRASADS